MKNYIIANLKMNKNSKEFEQYISEINSRIKNFKDWKAFKNDFFNFKKEKNIVILKQKIYQML